MCEYMDKMDLMDNRYFEWNTNFQYNFHNFKALFSCQSIYGEISSHTEYINHIAGDNMNAI